MVGGQLGGAPPVEELAATHGGDAWRVALVAGGDPGVATRAALHALVVGAVEGGPAAERTAILSLSRSWALSCAGAAARGGGQASDPAVRAFWALSEPLRSALWCADGLGLTASDADRVVGPGGGRAPGVARGRLRREACRHRRGAVAPGSPCAEVAPVLGPVLAGHAAGTKLARVEGHAGGCQDCARVLASLRDPAAAVAASLPPAPDLVAPAARAWREHVGAPSDALSDRVRRAAVAVGRHHRPVAALLAVVTAATFGSATSQLAASSGHPASPPVTVAAPPTRPAAAPPARPAAVARRQAVIPPLAADAVRDPGLLRLVTPELAEVAPAVTLPLAPPAAPPAAPAPALSLLGEPPPAEDRATTVDLSIPLPISVPVIIELGPSCSGFTLGPVRVTLPCKH